MIYCQPRDMPHRVWILRFEDADVADMVWTGEDAEQQARAAWDLHKSNWNMILLCTAEAPNED